MGMCFLSRAPVTWGRFHLCLNSHSIAFQSSRQVGQPTYSSLYCLMITSHTSGTMVYGQPPYPDRETELSPVARCLNIIANLKAWYQGLLKPGDLPLQCSLSVNISGYIHKQFMNAGWPSWYSSAMRLWY